MRHIEITKIGKVNGTNSIDVFHVIVGCKHLYYTDVATLVVDLQNYMLKPELVEKEVLNREVGEQLNIDVPNNPSRYCHPGPLYERPVVATCETKNQKECDEPGFIYRRK